MDVKHINAFITGLMEVTSMLGIDSLTRTALNARENLKTENEVNIIIGLVGDIRAMWFYPCKKTAMNVASKMMGGLPVNEFDLISKSVFVS